MFQRQWISENVLWSVLTIIMLGIFILVRIYNLDQTLEFFGDIGRDHLALLEWWNTGKIPLLGPGINYFSLHLPPIYYYLNFPVFIISGFSPYTTLITLLAIYSGVFLAGVIFFSKKEYKIAVFIMALLVTFQPQYIFQTRLPWNPTFAAPFLGVAISSLLLLREKYSIYKFIIFSTSLAGAVGLSIEVIPTVFVIVIFALWKLPNRVKNIFYFSVAMLLIFLPLIIFEIRHQFFFISRLIINPITQPFKTDMLNKFPNLLSFLFGVNEWNSLSLAIILIIFLIIFVYVIINRKHKNAIEINKVLFLLILFSLSVLLTYILPFPAVGHDIFGISILFFTTIAFLPLRLSLVTSGLLLVLWLNPVNLNNYFKPGHRTISEMEYCAVKVCSFEHDPMYISVQAWYIYHKTPEYQFMFIKKGCKVADITSSPDWSNKMMVIADNETYEHGKTAYNELTLFGKSEIEKEYVCGDKLQVYILKKTK